MNKNIITLLLLAIGNIPNYYILYILLYCRKIDIFVEMYIILFLVLISTVVVIVVGRFFRSSNRLREPE
jgi:membrane-bound ClpP family serine protease